MQRSDKISAGKVLGKQSHGDAGKGHQAGMQVMLEWSSGAAHQGGGEKLHERGRTHANTQNSALKAGDSQIIWNNFMKAKNCPPSYTPPIHTHTHTHTQLCILC